MQASNRLALGTVQFGLPYGIANRTGQVDRAAAAAIVEQARAAGLDTIDTAIAYGTSEQRLGEIGVSEWRIVSKLPALPESCADVRTWVRDSVRGSLQRLGVEKLAALLLHRPLQLLDGEGTALYAAMTELRAEGVCEKIGISVYGPQELDALCARFRFDLVQAPFNVIDRRLARSGWLQRLHEAGTEVHVRSVFLQGLLLMDAASLPPYFSQWAPLWQHWHDWLTRNELTPLQGALRHALSVSEIDRIVVGVDSPAHLQEILAAAIDRGADIFRDAAPDVECADTALVNPSAWKKS